MLVNDPVLISMIEELTDKYNKMQDFLIDDEPCIDIVRSVYELECTVSEFKKRIILQHISYCHSDECDDLERRQLREENIIQIVIEYLQQNTVLELKMSHVAKLANCFMGVIYSHFSSKEDLILACAYRQIKKDFACIEKALNQHSEPLDQMIMASILIWSVFKQQPSEYALKQFAINPHVWNAASISRVKSVTELVNTFSAKLSFISNQLFSDYKLGGQGVEAEQFNLGLFGLTLGLYQQSVSAFGDILGFNSSYDQQSNHHFKSLLVRYLSSWGLERQDMSERVESLSQLTFKNR